MRKMVLVEEHRLRRQQLQKRADNNNASGSCVRHNPIDVPIIHGIEVVQYLARLLSAANQRNFRIIVDQSREAVNAPLAVFREAPRIAEFWGDNALRTTDSFVSSSNDNNLIPPPSSRLKPCVFNNVSRPVKVGIAVYS